MKPTNIFLIKWPPQCVHKLILCLIRFVCPWQILPNFCPPMRCSSNKLHTWGPPIIHTCYSFQNNLRSQEFLQGHTNKIAVVAASRSGKYLASGQVLLSTFLLVFSIRWTLKLAHSARCLKSHIEELIMEGGDHKSWKKKHVPVLTIFNSIVWDEE